MLPAAAMAAVESLGAPAWIHSVHWSALLRETGQRQWLMRVAQSCWLTQGLSLRAIHFALVDPSFKVLLSF
jgi:hypothetical protein